jgi:uncharacterized protein (DUF58 family)
VGFAALNTGNNLLYLVLSLMLAFLVLSGVLSESALRGISVRRQLPRELFDGAPAHVGIEIGNAQRRIPAFAIVVEDHVREGADWERPAGRAFALRVGPGETLRKSYLFRPAGRGEVAFTGFQVITRFPFGLFSKALAIELPEQALVYPAFDALRAVPEVGAAHQSGERAGGIGSGGSQVSGLREYALGDPPRRIHWRRSVRRGELLVRDVEAERRDEIEVRLRTAGRHPGEGFERSVRWAASEVAAFLADGSRVGLRTDAVGIAADEGARQRARLLSFLARVAPDETRGGSG